MTLEIAQKCILDALNIVNFDSTVEFILFGGEPLLRFDLIKQIVEFVSNLKTSAKCRFFAATNGTLLTQDMKNWFQINKNIFVLGLSIDGNKLSHNINRPNSFDLIDLNFFKNTWPNQHVKMTVSHETLPFYASDVQYLHSLGFGINGADICLGKNDWRNKKLLISFAKQLDELVEYYSNLNGSFYNANFDIDIAICANPKKRMSKNCGVGENLFFYDADGNKYPCTFITPMTFKKEQIANLKDLNFSDPKNFTDIDCYNNCYLYPICKKCPAENLLKTQSFKIWDKSKCEYTELIALAKSELETRKIINNPHIYNETKLFYTIEAIKEIRSRYFFKYKNIISFMEE